VTLVIRFDLFTIWFLMPPSGRNGCRKSLLSRPGEAHADGHAVLLVFPAGLDDPGFVLSGQVLQRLLVPLCILEPGGGGCEVCSTFDGIVRIALEAVLFLEERKEGCLEVAGREHHHLGPAL
jgi:hypothetical protein